MNPLLEDIVTDWELVEDAVRNSDQHVLLYGPPGTGKSYIAQNFELDGRESFAVTLTDETPMAELRGYDAIVDGSMVWRDGVTVRSWRIGARLVLNEIGELGSDGLVHLYAICDDPDDAMLTLPTGETIRPHPRTQIIATTNEQPETLPTALLDRFKIVRLIDEPNPKAFERLNEPFKSAARQPDTTGAFRLRRWLSAETLFNRFISDGRNHNDSLHSALSLTFPDEVESLVDSLSVAMADSNSDGWTK